MGFAHKCCYYCFTVGRGDRVLPGSCLCGRSLPAIVLDVSKEVAQRVGGDARDAACVGERRRLRGRQLVYLLAREARDGFVVGAW